MALIYGYAWTSQYGESSGGVGGEAWGRALAGLTVTQIGDAIQSCEAVADDFPPSMPKFRRMALGVPSLAKAKDDVRNGRTTGFTRLLWRYMDPHHYRNASHKDADRMIHDAYELASEALMRGEPMPEEDVAVLLFDKEAKERDEKNRYESAHFNRLADLEKNLR